MPTLAETLLTGDNFFIWNTPTSFASNTRSTPDLFFQFVEPHLKKLTQISSPADESVLRLRNGSFDRFINKIQCISVLHQRPDLRAIKTRSDFRVDFQPKRNISAL